MSKEHYSFMERLGTFIESGQLAPYVGQRYRLEDTAKAIEQLEAGTSKGKSVIVVRESESDLGARKAH